MKKLLSILFILPFLSCSIEAEQSLDKDVVGDWVLVQTWGQFAGSDATGADMPFQETYHLDKDGTFLKIRIQDGEELKSTGTYKISKTGWTIDGDGAGVFIELQHESRNPLVANCTLTVTEHLYLTTEGALRSTHEACDGLGVLYEKLD